MSRLSAPHWVGGQADDHTVELPEASGWSGPRRCGATSWPQCTPTRSLYRNHPEGTPRNVWAGIWTRSTCTAITSVNLDAPVPVIAEVTPAGAATLDLARGGTVYASVKATEVLIYPA